MPSQRPADMPPGNAPLSPLWPPALHYRQDHDSSPPASTLSGFSVSSRGPGPGPSGFTTPEHQESQHLRNTLSVSHARWMDPFEDKSDGPMINSSSSRWNSDISSADHRSLLNNSNTAYTQLLDAHSQLLSRHQEIQRDYQDLKARYENTMMAYDKLVSSISDKLTLSVSSNPDSMLLSSETADHMKQLDRVGAINYWTEAEYLKEDQRRRKEKGKATMQDVQLLRGRKRLIEGDENVMLWFIEDENGDPISGSRAKKAREEARKIWIYLATKGHAPPQWNNASSFARNYYVSEMRKMFSELRLCELDYKSHRIATQNYSGWYKHYLGKRDSEAKTEPEITDLVALDTVSGPASEGPDEEPAQLAPKKSKKGTRSAGGTASGRKRTAPEGPDEEPAPKKSKKGQRSAGGKPVLSGFRRLSTVAASDNTHCIVGIHRGTRVTDVRHSTGTSASTHFIGFRCRSGTCTRIVDIHHSDRIVDIHRSDRIIDVRRQSTSIHVVHWRRCDRIDVCRRDRIIASTHIVNVHWRRQDRLIDVRRCDRLIDVRCCDRLIDIRRRESIIDVCCHQHIIASIHIVDIHWRRHDCLINVRHRDRLIDVRRRDRLIDVCRRQRTCIDVSPVPTSLTSPFPEAPAPTASVIAISALTPTLASPPAPTLAFAPSPTLAPAPAPAAPGSVAKSHVHNPLASFGKPGGPATPTGASASKDKAVYLRATSSNTIRNLCLKNYIATKGKVTKDVFDDYFKNLSAEELEFWKKRSAEAGAAHKAAMTDS
ncbi:hypothetical protein GGX14DRAFT_653862 [Mycena pura]|uniref:Uncharacterized protein n=1 Tax=Mycena pura TaxID=153505 RepID=A0AAD6YCN2_9AGAR|nr:hypothetical protein GGX14DRAFT_653862 [Mycena pura]